MSRFKRSSSTAVGIFVLSCISTGHSLAGGFSASDPFSLRFDAALSRYGNYGDVLGAGGASTGSTFSSSTNPASTAVRNPKHDLLTISPQLTKITFDNNHELDLAILGGTYRINDRQKIEYGIATVDSEPAMRRGDPAGSTFDLEADLYTIAWSSSLGDRNQCDEPSHFIGASYASQSTDTSLSFGANTVLRDAGDSNSISIGYLYHTRLGRADNTGSGCNKKIDRNNLALGVNLTYGEGDTTRNSLISTSGNSNSDNYTVRFGVGYRVGQGRYLYADLQYGKYNNTSVSNVSDSIDVSRLFTGIQWQIPENPGDGFRAFVRAGVVLDVEGNESQTLGLGTILYKSNDYQLGVDMAYQRNMFPEIQPEFGDSELFNISFRLKFKQ